MLRPRLLALFAVLSACGPKMGGHVVSHVTSAIEGSGGALQAAWGRDAATMHLGQASAAQVASLKYYFMEIQICQTLETTGTAYNNPGACLLLYTNNNGPDYNTFDAAAARAHTTDYLDLKNPADLNRLKQGITVSENDTGEYHYGVISWYRPIKVTASVPYLDGSGVLYTKDGDYNAATGQTETTGLANAPAQEAVVALQNGGNWFKFQNPFVITDADINDKTDFTIDLVFNPDKVVGGFSLSTRSGVLRDTTTCAAIWAPMLDLSPVPRGLSQTTVRESYLLHQTAMANNKFDLRLELYSIKSDPARVIYGADLKGIMVAGSTSEAMAQKISFITTAADGLQFEDYQRKAMISGFVRLDTAGQTGTANLECNGTLPVLSENGCESGQAPVTVELVSVTDVP